MKQQCANAQPLPVQRAFVVQLHTTVDVAQECIVRVEHVVSGQTVHSHYEEMVDAYQCAHDVMGAYYPTAVYCDKQLFIAHGWQGCFTAAGVAVLAISSSP